MPNYKSKRAFIDHKASNGYYESDMFYKYNISTSGAFLTISDGHVSSVTFEFSPDKAGVKKLKILKGVFDESCDFIDRLLQAANEASPDPVCIDVKDRKTIRKFLNPLKKPDAKGSIQMHQGKNYVSVVLADCSSQLELYEALWSYEKMGENYGRVFRTLRVVLYEMLVFMSSDDYNEKVIKSKEKKQGFTRHRTQNH